MTLKRGQQQQIVCLILSFTKIWVTIFFNSKSCCPSSCNFFVVSAKMSRTTFTTTNVHTCQVNSGSTHSRNINYFCSEDSSLLSSDSSHLQTHHHFFPSSSSPKTSQDCKLNLSSHNNLFIVSLPLNTDKHEK